VLAEKRHRRGKAPIADLLSNNFAASPEELRDHRLIVMFFDLSSMQDEDIDRAVDAAKDYINKQMAAGRPGRAGEHVHRPEHGPGLHQRQAARC
jgi:2-phospho-L-lactate guanylyltransferase (CobY/MobA/RfbA family)